MEKSKVKLNKALYIVLASAITIAIFSFTIGRELYEGRTQSLTSFGLIHFSGYLFFLLMPVEMAFVYYLSYYRETELIWIALVTAVTAQFIDYIIGLFFSLKSLTSLVGEKRILKAEKYIQKYGNLTIFVFNFFPLSSPVVALAAGLLKHPLKDFVIFSVLGLFLKYLVLSLIFSENVSLLSFVIHYNSICVIIYFSDPNSSVILI